MESKTHKQRFQTAQDWERSLINANSSCLSKDPRLITFWNCLKAAIATKPSPLGALITLHLSFLCQESAQETILSLKQDGEKASLSK
jgi:hypothetical protein